MVKNAFESIPDAAKVSELLKIPVEEVKIILEK